MFYTLFVIYVSFFFIKFILFSNIIKVTKIKEIINSHIIAYMKKEILTVT